MDAHPPPFRLLLASLPPRALDVHELRGTEKLSRPYRFDVTCTAKEPLPAPGELLASPAVLILSAPRAPRVFSGAVAAVWQEGLRRDADGSEQVRLRLVPRFALRKHRRSSRIFQDLPVPEIVRRVLAEAGVSVEMRLKRHYPRRAYCTQYQETDTAFVDRILAEAGIFSFWQPPEASPEDMAALDPRLWAGDTLVLGDDASAYGEAATPILRFLEAEGTAGHAMDKVTRFVPRAAVRPERATFREYDPDRPQTVLQAEVALEGRTGSPLELYDHEAPFLFDSWKLTQEEPRQRLHAARRDAETARGESTAPHLAAGQRFTLEDHPWDPANGPHVVLEVRHEGASTPRNPGALRYRNRFATAPASLPIPPALPRQRVLGLTLTATVTGPPGEEIHTDERGRIKVQFHWDREGKRDDHSSCWIAVMQSWAGTGWGSQIIPRVGMEVVVSFDGGDPDKPLVLGCLPNGTHPPPFPLPASKTRSGLRTQSSPGGGGFNELSFEDRAGEERIYVHAQRDLEEVVGNDRTRVVRGGEEVTIEGHARRAVGGSAEEAVQGDVTQRIGGEHRIHVAGPSQSAHASQRITTVAGDEDLRVGGARRLCVTGEQRVEVRGPERREVHGDVIERVGGSRVLLVGEAGAPRSFTLHAEGTATLQGTEQLVLSSPRELTLQVGKTFLRLTEHGIELSGDRVVVAGQAGSLTAAGDGLSLRARGKAEIAAETVHLHSQGDAASIVMQKDVEVKGARVLLNSPEQSRDAPPKDGPVPTVIVLRDEEGAPIPHQRFVIREDGHGERAGVLDGEGRAEIHLEASPGEARICFPDLPPPAVEGSSSLVPHVVQAGDSLDTIAHRLGFSAAAIWRSERNQELRARRPDPDLLAPGDVLWVPRSGARREEPLAIGAENRYQRRVPKVTVVLWLRRGDGSPLADEPCEVRGLGIVARSDAEGRLALSLPLHVRAAELWIPSLQVAQTILLGHLDPADTASGLKQHLANLGYDTYHGFDEAPGEAIARFQRDFGLPPTGVADAATVEALKSVHDRAGGT
jgi:type VI secretion system secreted protein VgrG